MKKILYIDMDNVLVDFSSGIAQLDPVTKEKYASHYDDVPGIFSLMEPVKDAVFSFNLLSEIFETYILSTAPWENSSAWADKLLWVKKHLGDKAYKRLIISHRKDLNKGHYLVDDREKNGAKDFEGELILFGTEKYLDWQLVCEYLLLKNNFIPGKGFYTDSFILKSFGHPGNESYSELLLLVSPDAYQFILSYNVRYATRVERIKIKQEQMQQFFFNLSNSGSSLVCNFSNSVTNPIIIVHLLSKFIDHLERVNFYEEDSLEYLKGTFKDNNLQFESSENLYSD